MFQSQSYKKYFLFSFAIIFIVNLLVTLILFFYFLENEKSVLYKSYFSEAQSDFLKTEDFIKDRFNHYKLLLTSLEKSKAFKQYLESKESKNIEEMMNLIISSNKKVFQIRYIDKEGLEKIRLDKSNNGKIAKAKTLQNKTNRYYFKKSEKLNKHRFYISNLDLNIEYEKIEIPYKPTIRISKSIFTNGKFNGILILNYHANDIIKSIKDKSNFDVYYVDKELNFFLHPNEKKNFSTQLGTNYKVKDEISNFNDIVEVDKKDKYQMYYIKKVTLTDDYFYILYSIKKEIYTKNFKEIQNNLIILFLTLFIITIPIIFIALNIQASQMMILEAIIKNIPYPIFLKSKKEKIVLANDSLLKLNGLDNLSQIIGKSFDEIMDKNEAKKFQDNINRAYKNGSIEKEIEVLTYDGKKYYYDIKVFKLSLFGFLHKIYILGIAIDITKIKSLNIGLQELVNKEVEKRIELENILTKKIKMAEIGNMIENLLLQWKLPLSIISVISSGYDYKLQIQNVKKNEIIKAFQDISNQVKLMSQDTIDFKNFFSLNKKSETFLIELVFKQIERILKQRLKNKDIKINYDLDNSLTLKGYENNFGHVILNLLNNAIDALEKSDINTKLITICSFKEKDIIKIEIRNNAGKIPDKFLPNILFEMFFTTKDNNNTGLGLYISKQIIEKDFKGSIIAYNKNKNTAVFCIEIKKEF